MTIGTGYFKPVSRVCFSDFGHDVVRVDKMSEKVAMLDRSVESRGQREGEALLAGVVCREDPYKAVENADILVILTEWNQSRARDRKMRVKKVAQPGIAVLRNIYSAEKPRRAGFEAYLGVGR